MERRMVGKMLSHFRPVEKIDEGGMGEVSRTHDTANWMSDHTTEGACAPQRICLYCAAL